MFREFYKKNHIQNTDELINSINHLIIHAFYIYLFDVRLPETYLKKREAYRSVEYLRIIDEVYC